MPLTKLKPIVPSLALGIRVMIRNQLVRVLAVSRLPCPFGAVARHSSKVATAEGVDQPREKEQRAPGGSSVRR